MFHISGGTSVGCSAADSHRGRGALNVGRNEIFKERDQQGRRDVVGMTKGENCEMQIAYGYECHYIDYSYVVPVGNI